MHDLGYNRPLAITLAIITVAATLGMLASWRAPGIDRYTRDWLIRARGVMPVPDDIAIIAIDEASIRRFGRFPWARSVMAKAIDRLADAESKVIALDVLYTDPTNPEADEALAAAIAKAGNVVAAAQLIEAPVGGGQTAWLTPISGIRRSAAATGHVNVQTESDGVARELALLVTDDAGQGFRAMALQAIRIAERVPDEAITETRHTVLVGPRVIPVKAEGPTAVVEQAGHSGNLPGVLRAGRMAIDYIGPAGSFSANTYSVADVVDGRISPAQLRSRYVLIGATAASLGDRLSAPFVHYSGVGGNQHGSLMPGVEVLANEVNTILRSRFYSDIPDWLAFLWAAAVAALTLFLLSVAQGGREGLKQIVVLGGMAATILASSYLAFAFALTFPPVTQQAVSFATAGVLGLLRRSLVTGATLDETLYEVARASESPAVLLRDTVAQSIVRLTGAEAVAIFSATGAGDYRLASIAGLPLARALAGRETFSTTFVTPSASRFFALRDRVTSLDVLTVPLARHDYVDFLIVAYPAGRQPSDESVRIAVALAESCAWSARNIQQATTSNSRLPLTLEARANTLRQLNIRMIQQTRFTDLALRSVEDGLIITGVDGRISFANPKASSILQSSENALVGADLLQRISALEETPGANLNAQNVLATLLVDRSPVECEIAIRNTRPARYILRLAPVCLDSMANGPVLGIVASLSDITRQQELQQTKNDVISLVSHEMRTPLTAIQGMSELLANYDVEPERRREMNLAINDEVKRLTRMITQYLDITRLESGATVLRRSPVRPEVLLERTLLLLEPLAAIRNIRLTRVLEGDLRPLLADPDLLSRAIENLVSNAIKYSPGATVITVKVCSTDGGIQIEVADQGYGIPVSDLNRVFEKFYRIPRTQDADAPGTGLGLSLVKEIAELHGGTITVKSRLHEGSTFTLTLPTDNSELSTFVKSN